MKRIAVGNQYPSRHHSQTLARRSAAIASTPVVVNSTSVAILGAGPAGLGAALQLARSGKAKAIVLEQQDAVGGNAGSFELEGIQVDFGSHRLHPSCQTRILDDLRGLLRQDLIDRPRHGRIRLQGRWLHFPLKPLDLLLKVPWSFRLGVARDALRGPGTNSSNGKEESFGSLLERSLGSTICRDFYFPYAEKIWGLTPDAISATQARRRVSAGSLTKMARKALALVPGFKAPGAGRFFYPQRGYGQISEVIAKGAGDLGAEIRLRSKVRKLRLGNPHRIVVESEGGIQTIEAKHVWSTIPLTVLAQIVDPEAPPQIAEACSRVEYRAMILIYLVLGQNQFSPFDAHYFPEAGVRLTRLSEPKNYSGVQEPVGRTVLCAELPCQIGDDSWCASDEELGGIVEDSLRHCDLAIRGPILKVATRRLPYAYPIYRKGYEKSFDLLDEWVGGLDRVLTFGRQGLFAHDNTHHALAMAYSAVDCLDESGRFNNERWREYRAEFAQHVVED
jgi:protoporphyrinogen oxidase